MEKKLQVMVTPIERRTIRLSGSKTTLGKVELWVDIFSAEGKPTEPMNIKAPPKVPFVMRMVVWRTAEIPAMDEWTGSSDLFIKAELEWSDANKQRKSLTRQTDTHWFAKDGAASFNYRLVFDIDLPVSKPKFSISAYDRDPLAFSADLVGDSDPIDVPARLFKPVMKEYQKYGPLEALTQWPKEEDRDDPQKGYKGDSLQKHKITGGLAKWIRVEKRVRNPDEARRHAKDHGGGGGYVVPVVVLLAMCSLLFWEKYICHPCSTGLTLFDFDITTDLRNLLPEDEKRMLGGCSVLHAQFMLGLGALLILAYAPRFLTRVIVLNVMILSGDISPEHGLVWEVTAALKWIGLTCTHRLLTVVCIPFSSCRCSRSCQVANPMRPSFHVLPLWFGILSAFVLTGGGGYAAYKGNVCSSSSMAHALRDNHALTPDTSTCHADAPLYTLKSLQLKGITDCTAVVVEACQADATYWSSGYDYRYENGTNNPPPSTDTSLSPSKLVVGAPVHPMPISQFPPACIVGNPPERVRITSDPDDKANQCIFQGKLEDMSMCGVHELARLGDWLTDNLTTNMLQPQRDTDDYIEKVLDNKMTSFLDGGELVREFYQEAMKTQAFSVKDRKVGGAACTSENAAKMFTRRCKEAVKRQKIERTPENSNVCTVNTKWSKDDECWMDSDSKGGKCCANPCAWENYNEGYSTEERAICKVRYNESEWNPNDFRVDKPVNILKEKVAAQLLACDLCAQEIAACNECNTDEPKINFVLCAR